MTVLENGDLGKYAKRRVNEELTSGGNLGRSLCDRDALAVRIPLIRRPPRNPSYLLDPASA
jgi:hypothetical protein